MSMVNFETREPGQADDAADEIARNLHETYPRENMLTLAPAGEWNVDLVQGVIDCLTPLAFWITSFTQDIHGGSVVVFDKKEATFGAEYTVKEIDADLREVSSQKSDFLILLSHIVMRTPP